MLQTLLGALLAIGLGAVLALFGRRVFVVLLPIFGFFAGFWVGAEFVHLILGSGFLGTVAGWVVGFFLALVGAVLTYLFFPAGVALVAGVLGAGLVTGMMQWAGIDASWILTLVGLLVGLAVAWVAFWKRWDVWLVMGLTAIAGGMLVALGVALLLGSVTTEEVGAQGSAILPLLQSSIWWAVLTAALAVIGFVAQYRASRDFQYTQYNHVEIWA